MNIFEEVVLSKAQLSPKLIVDYFDMEWPSTIIFLVITLIALTQNNSYFNHDDDMIPITHVKKNYLWNILFPDYSLSSDLQV